MGRKEIHSLQVRELWGLHEGTWWVAPLPRTWDSYLNFSEFLKIPTNFHFRSFSSLPPQALASSSARSATTSHRLYISKRRTVTGTNSTLNRHSRRQSYASSWASHSRKKRWTDVSSRQQWHLKEIPWSRSSRWTRSLRLSVSLQTLNARSLVSTEMSRAHVGTRFKDV